MTVSETLAVALERWVEQPQRARRRAAPADGVRRRATRHALRVDELIELMGLGEYRNSFVRELSTGTRRIVDLACLVAHRPTVILLDEPSRGIAQREVEALAPVLRRLRDEMGAELVVIEHDIPLVSDVSDRLIALDQGRVIATGPPADVLAHPDVVESYLGTSSAAISPLRGNGVAEHATSTGRRRGIVIVVSSGDGGRSRRSSRWSRSSPACSSPRRRR